MPFRISWYGDARQQFHTIVSGPHSEALPLIAALAGRQHDVWDVWLAGVPISDPEILDGDWRLLQLGKYQVYCELREDERSVQIVAIVS